jgi:predicted enzyme related to lactoylglutathione lyase
MPHPNLTILYVDSPAASAAFYADLLGREPLEASPTFAMFALETGAKLGLWSRHTVEPAATAPGGVELAFPVQDVEAEYERLTARRMPVAQPVTEMDFGRTFVVLDPDGHRLRVYAPGP